MRLTWASQVAYVCFFFFPAGYENRHMDPDPANLIICESELHGWESRMPCPILSHMGIRLYHSQCNYLIRHVPNRRCTLPVL